VSGFDVALIGVGGGRDLNNVTISGNTANNSNNYPGGGGLAFQGLNPDDFFTFQNTIIAGNTDATNTAPDCSTLQMAGATFASQGYNLIGNNTNCAFTPTTGDRVGSGATPINPLLSATTLVNLMNEYLSAMTDVIFKNWGTLDKYIGDAIMAFWGAPYPQTDHAERACRRGLEMLRTLGGVQAKCEVEGKPCFDVGVGICTGPMVVGNIGSTKRFNFTVMGDPVNLAARLEGINKEFGSHLIINETTYAAVKDKFAARELDLIRVKRKMKPVTIYELPGSRDELDRFRDQIERFHQGLEAYRTAQWEKALGIFKALTSDYFGDGPAHVFVKRCRGLLAEPPQGAWDGVYVMKTK
jgi:adenylate cyclase